jgi:hypothetical protein
MRDAAIKLYHGTTSIFLKSILKKGLLPRKYTGISNWDSRLTGRMIDRSSDPELVYLTKTPEKARNIGYRAVKLHRGELAILMALVSEEFLVPDEDSRKKTWEASLRTVGTCAYRGRIHPENISLCEIVKAAA